MPKTLGMVNGALGPCPDTPNCVRTGGAMARSGRDDSSGDRFPPNLVLRSNDQATWTALVDAVLAMPRTRVVTRGDRYLHAEVRTLVFRFVDDLELLWLVDQGEVQVRSASRVGAGDLGVNRRRVQRVRALARERRLLEETGLPD